MFRRNHHHQGEYYMSSLKLQLYWLVLTILSTITLVSSNIALPDDGGYTETCWRCFKVNFNRPFKAILWCIGW